MTPCCFVALDELVEGERRGDMESTDGSKKRDANAGVWLLTLFCLPAIVPATTINITITIIYGYYYLWPLALFCLLLLWVATIICGYSLLFCMAVCGYYCVWLILCVATHTILLPAKTPPT